MLVLSLPHAGQGPSSGIVATLAMGMLMEEILAICELRLAFLATSLVVSSNGLDCFEHSGSPAHTQAFLCFQKNTQVNTKKSSNVRHAQ